MADSKILILRKQQKNATKTNISKELARGHDILDSNGENNADNINVVINKLANYQKKLQELDEEILIHCDEDTIAEEVTKSSDLVDSILELTEQLRAMCAQKETQNIASSPSSVSGTSHKNNFCSVKLPKLEIANFHGDPLKWQEFWDNYETTIHHNESLSEIDKLKYLKNFVKGDVLRLVEGYRLTAANYESVIETLKERYGNPQLAVFSHFEKMLTLPAASHEFMELQRVFDDCERHIRSLVALGLPEETFGQVFTPIVLSKLPKFVRMELHRRNGSVPWTLGRLRELLRDEIRARSMSQDKANEPQPPKSSNFKPDHHSVNRSRSFHPQAMHRRSKETTTSSSLLSSSSQKNLRCAYCSGGHYSDQCSKFRDSFARRGQLKDRCLVCLKEGHMVRECRTCRPCVHCKKEGHHRSLCHQKFGKKGNSNADVSLPVGESQSPASTTMPVKDTNLLSHGEQTILQTAVTKAIGTTQRSARLLLDTGCSRSFVTSRLCREIGARFKGEEVTSIAGFSQSRRKTLSYKIYEFDILLKDGSRKTIVANATDVITCPVQKAPLDAKKHPFVKSLELAEPLVTEPQMVDIDILIGGDYYYDLVESEQIKCSDGLVFLSSSLGYVAAGRILRSQPSNNNATSLLLTKAEALPETNFDIERLWRLEDIGIKDSVETFDDEKALQSFNETIKFENGRYSVKWPWKQDTGELSDNFGLSKGRLSSLMKRLSGSSELLKRYDDTIKDQIQKKIVELAPSFPEGNNVYYMPHHCVITPQKTTTKLRVVYDASSKSTKNDLSLNECIYRGPIILRDLAGLLLRFRLHKIAIVSDIEKAFLQISLQSPDRDVTRFLWLKDIDKPASKENTVAYRFCRVPFGVNASPFLLAGTITHHLNKIGSPTANQIKENIYVDNVICGKETSDEAAKYYDEAKDIFKQCSMNLREWYSNDEDFLAQISENDRGNDQTTKVLGLSWDCKTDVLRCSVGKIDEDVMTKRGYMKGIASVFDPCGYFSPVTVRGKMLLQEIWKRKYDWDKQLPTDLLERAKSVLAEVKGLPTVDLNRCYGNDVMNSSNTFELHCFCDASAHAYSSVIYLRIISGSTVQTQLLFSKSRVSPLKELTIPKLELMAMVIGVRALTFVEKELPLTFDKVIVWTDSQCVLHWILGKQVTTPFVRNRVKEIKNKRLEFRYVHTSENPADLPSRGTTLAKLTDSSLWWNGPPWLQFQEKEWPKCEKEFANTEKKTDAEHSDSVLAIADNKMEKDCLMDISKYSTLTKLLRVTGWVFRFLNNIRATDIKKGCLNAKEIESAKLYWLKTIQDKDLSKLSAVKRTKEQLGLFIDEQGLIRCRGRYEYSELPEGAKTPILLPNNDNSFTNLVIMDYHRQLLHAGMKHTLSQIRNNYWIIKGRSEVKRVIRRCLHCIRILGGPFRVPQESPLPSFRTSQQDPFSCVGIDYFGPLYVTEQGEDASRKVWICLFTCAVVRAIHLEIVEDMSAQQFLLCLRRFVATFGVPTLIISDNAKQFHSSKKALDALFSVIQNSSEVQDYCAVKGIEWKFITEMAPWMGGFYERMVGVVKQSLKKCLGRRLISSSELHTIVTEVIDVVNSRPLIYSDEEAGETCLTPAHFLLRHRNKFPRMSENVSEFDRDNSSRKRLVCYWKRIQALLDSFWKMWKNQYLLSLREQWRESKQRGASDFKPAVGTTVFVQDNGPRTNWKLGLVVELIASRDGQNRSAKIRLPNGRFFRRSLKHLYPIETLPGYVDEAHVPQQSPTSKPCRYAACVAREKIKEQLRCPDSEENINVCQSLLFVVQNTMPEKIFISSKHPLSRFFVYTALYQTDEAITSIEMGFWGIILRQHSRQDLYRRLIKNKSLQANPGDIVWWLQRKGFKISTTWLFYSAVVYYCVMAHQMQQWNSGFRKAFLKEIRAYDPQNLPKFVVCSSKSELVWSSGCRPHFKHDDFPGMNIYGELLEALAVGYFNQEYEMPWEMSQLSLQRVIVEPSPDLSVLIIADSQCRSVQSISNGEIVSVSGGTFFDMARGISMTTTNGLRLSDFNFIIIHCGINDCQKSKLFQKRSWLRMKGILIREAERRREKTILVSPGFPHPYAPNSSTYCDFINSELSGTDILCIDWSENNPFLRNGDIIPELFERDNFHVSHAGFGKLWKNWCQKLYELRYVSYKLSANSHNIKMM